MEKQLHAEGVETENLWLGNGPGTGGCTLHNPHYDFNDALLPLGITYWSTLVKRLLPRAD